MQWPVAIRRRRPEPDPEPEPAVREVIQNRRQALADPHASAACLRSGRRALGALTLVAGERAAPYEAPRSPWGRAVAGMIAVAIDNSRLHAEVEARSDANQVLTHVGEGVFLVNRAGVVQPRNPATAAITGVSAEAVVGTPASDAIPDWHGSPPGFPSAPPTSPCALDAPAGHGAR